MQEGINLDPDMLIQVLQNKLVQAVVKEAQLESAVQSQAREIQALKGQVQALSEEEADNASAK